MAIGDDELRAMVRLAIERHGQADAARMPPPLEPLEPRPHVHASHARLVLIDGGDPDGRCLIEPSVACNHCGYCQSLGH